jgi:hypothetical protein
VVKESLLIPVGKAVPPWDAALDQLQRGSFIPIPVQTEAQKINFKRVEIIWQVTLHWVFKLKWFSKHKIPYSRKLTNVCKPFGELVFRYLELCIQCHAMKPIGSIPYGNASDWFVKLVRETQLNAFFSNDSPGKVQRLKERRKQLDLLKEGENPFSSESYPHLHRLIEACRSLLISDQFENDYWKPFLKAYSAWITMFESKDWTTSYEEDEKFYIRMGQGKGRLRVQE